MNKVAQQFRREMISHIMRQFRKESLRVVKFEKLGEYILADIKSRIEFMMKI